jgi:hypothetical protein
MHINTFLNTIIHNNIMTDNDQIDNMEKQNRFEGLIKKLASGNEEDKIDVVIKLSYFGSEAVDVLIMELPKSQGLLQDTIVWALGEIGDLKAVEALLNAQVNEAYFASTMDRIAEKNFERANEMEAAVPKLLDALKNEDNRCRHSAIRALHRIGDERAAIPLAKHIFLENDRDVRMLTAVALGNFKTAEEFAPKMFIELLKKSIPNADAVAMISEVVVCFGEPAVPDLHELLNGDDYSLKVAAAKILGKIHDPRSVAILCEKIWAPGSGIGAEADKALETIEFAIDLKGQNATKKGIQELICRLHEGLHSLKQKCHDRKMVAKAEAKVNELTNKLRDILESRGWSMDRILVDTVKAPQAVEMPARIKRKKKMECN